MVKGGYDAIVEEIVRLKPDFVTLSEVRNYHNTNFTRRLTQSLLQRGLTYYSFKSKDTGLLSRYPITEQTVDRTVVVVFRKNGEGLRWQFVSRDTHSPYR